MPANFIPVDVVFFGARQQSYPVAEVQTIIFDYIFVPINDYRVAPAVKQAQIFYDVVLRDNLSANPRQ